jgi:hypothetical protein
MWEPHLRHIALPLKYSYHRYIVESTGIHSSQSTLQSIPAAVTYDSPSCSHSKQPSGTDCPGGPSASCSQTTCPLKINIYNFINHFSTAMQGSAQVFLSAGRFQQG